MFTITCPDCKREAVPVQECYRLGDQLKCSSCVEREHPGPADRERVNAVGLASMRTCAFCGKDGGQVVVKNMGGSPVCGTCSQNIISRPFPAWVKAFFAGVMLLVVFSVAWNWKFFRAKSDLTTMNDRLSVGDIDGAILAVDEYHTKMDAEPELVAAKSYWMGIRALANDSPTKAIDLFSSVERTFPGAFETQDYVAAAHMGLAFDNGDYDEFLRLSREALEKRRDDPSAFGGVASAFACLYVANGNEAYRDSALWILEKAKTISVDSAFLDYEQRILHRLHSKEIISPAAFKARFPSGWKP